MSNYQIRIKQIPEFVKLAQHLGKCLYIIGASGIGKTESIHQVAKEMFPENKQPLIDIRLGGKETPDFTGMRIPTQKEDKSGKVVTVNEFVYADWIPDEDWEGVILLDELSHADPIIQKPAYQVLRDRMVEHKPLPKGAVLVGAGNRLTDNGGTFELLSPLANDLLIVEIDYESQEAADDWVEYAQVKGVHPAIIAMVRADSRQLHTFEASKKAATQSFATPRSLVRASECIYYAEKHNWSNHMLGTAVQGFIGNSVSDFFTRYQLGKYIPDVMAILKGEADSLLGTPSAELSDGLYWYLADMVYNRFASILDEYKNSKDVYIEDGHPEYTEDMIVKYFNNYGLFLEKNCSNKADIIQGIFSNTFELIKKQGLNSMITKGSWVGLAKKYIKDQNKAQSLGVA